MKFDEIVLATNGGKLRNGGIEEAGMIFLEHGSA
jgi:hypothetical protein